jgi:hypothetical protein
MARILEAKQGWTISGTTGGGKAYQIGPEASLISVYFTSSSGCTATVQLQTCAGSSAGPWVGMGSSTALSSGATTVHQFSGPLEWVRPYCSAIKASTDVVTVTLIAN